MGHTARVDGPIQRHRRLFDVLEGLIALAFFCGAVIGLTAFVIVMSVRGVAHLVHGG